MYFKKTKQKIYFFFVNILENLDKIFLFPDVLKSDTCFLEAAT